MNPVAQRLAVHAPILAAATRRRRDVGCDRAPVLDAQSRALVTQLPVGARSLTR